MAGTSPTTTNMLAHWALEDVNDSKGTRTLTNYNTTPFNAAKVGNGADFTPGSNHLLDNASVFGTDTDGDFSVSFWIKFDVVGGTRLIISSYRASLTVGDWFIRTADSGGTFRFQRKVASNSLKWVSTTAFGTGTWYHVVIVYKSSDATAKAYVNGTEETFTKSVQGDEGWRLPKITLGGYASNDGTYTIDGILDEMSVFNDQLTADEVTWIYNAGTGRTYSAYDTLDGGSVILWADE